MSLSVCFNYR